MVAPADIKACTGCARAKRKCGKEQPACRRCRCRGAQCHYPPAKPANFVALEPPRDPASEPLSAAAFATLFSQNAVLVNTAGLAASVGSGSETSSGASNQAALSGTQAGDSGPGNTPRSSITDEQSQALWFLTPESWKVDHRSGTITTSYCSSVLTTYVDDIKGWLESWVKTGECAFIHSRVYMTRFPDCVQIAYTTMSSYLHKTDGNTGIILHVVQEQANKLLSDNGAVLDDSGYWQISGSANATCAPSILSQIARIHALTIYQIISLFDGDIRSRHLAERRLVILSKWSNQLLDNARETFSPQFVESTDPRRYQVTEMFPMGGTDYLAGPDPDHPWYIWILTETIRRSWVVASGLETVYFMLQCGWYPCSGGITFTTNEGVWDAKTAVEWERVCEKGNVRLMQRFDCQRIFAEHRPGDVDQFTKSVMQITYGIERMERWYGDSRNRGMRSPTGR